VTLGRVSAGLLLWLDTEQTGGDVMGHTGNGPHGSSNDGHWNPDEPDPIVLEQLATITSLTARIAAAERKLTETEDALRHAIDTSAKHVEQYQERLAAAEKLLREVVNMMVYEGCFSATMSPEWFKAALKASEAAKGAARLLWTSVRCHDMHHTPAQYHQTNEPCKAKADFVDKYPFLKDSPNESDQTS
jgi:hypothetical protein